MLPLDQWQTLAHLWLHEPGADSLARWQSLAPQEPAGDAGELAPAYTDLVLLNVWPYGTAYTDPWGEINTPEAQSLGLLYARAGYAPPELREAGAPDHIGLCLGFMAHAASALPPTFLPSLALWAPLCCFAAERDPSALPFYRALARRTREAVLAVLLAGSLDAPDAPADVAGRGDGELRLRDIARFLLTPARCGFYLSRARLGQIALALGMRLPFGSRHDVAHGLLAGAGEGGRLYDLLSLLRAEAAVWDEAYATWAARWPAWGAAAALWRGRVAAARGLFDQMEQQARDGVAVEFTSPGDAEPPVDGFPDEV